MLLVKSKELKNSDKKIAGKPCFSRLSTLPLILISNTINAQTESESITSVSSVLSVFLSLLFVIAIIFAFAYVMRRFNVTQAGNGQMQVVASLMAGSKEKVMVIQVGDEQHLLGITAQNINHLAKLEQPLHNPKLAQQGKVETNAILSTGERDLQKSSQNNFQQKLVQAMAQAISGKKDSGSKHA